MLELLLEISRVDFPVSFLWFCLILAGGLFVDYLVRGKHHVIPRNPKRLSPDSLTAMTIPASSAPALVGIGTQAPAWASVSAEIKETASNNSGATEASLSRE